MVPLWEKSNLTLKEAAEYTGIGINKLRDISNSDNCPFVLWVGGKLSITMNIYTDATDNMKQRAFQEFDDAFNDTKVDTKYVDL